MSDSSHQISRSRRSRSQRPPSQSASQGRNSQRVRRATHVLNYDSNGNPREIPTGISGPVLRDTVNMSRPRSPPPPPPLPDPGEDREASPLPHEACRDPRQSNSLEETAAQQTAMSQNLAPRSQSLVSNSNASILRVPLPVDSELREPIAELIHNNDILSQHLVSPVVQNTAEHTVEHVVTTLTDIPLTVNNLTDIALTVIPPTVHYSTFNPEQFLQLLHRVQSAVGFNDSSTITRSLLTSEAAVTSLLEMEEEEFRIFIVRHNNSLTVSAILPRVQSVVGSELAQRVAEASAALLDLRDLISMNDAEFTLFVNQRLRRITNSNISNADFRRLGGLLVTTQSSITTATHTQIPHPDPIVPVENRAMGDLGLEVMASDTGLGTHVDTSPQVVPPSIALPATTTPAPGTTYEIPPQDFSEPVPHLPTDIESIPADASGVGSPRHTAQGTVEMNTMAPGNPPATNLDPNSESSVLMDSRGVINSNDLASGQPESTINPPDLSWLYQVQQNTRRVLYRIRELCLGPQGEELLPTYLCEVLASALAREPEATDLFDIDNSTFRSRVSSFLTRNRFRFPSIESSTFYNIITSSTALPFDNPQPVVVPLQEDEQSMYLTEDPFVPMPQVPIEELPPRPAQLTDQRTEAHSNTPRDLSTAPLDIRALEHPNNDTYWRLQVRTLEPHPSPFVESAAQALAEYIPQEIMALHQTIDGNGSPYFDEHQQVHIREAYMNARIYLNPERDPFMLWNGIIERFRLHQVASRATVAEALNQRNSNFYVPILYRAYGILTSSTLIPLPIHDNGSNVGLLPRSGPLNPRTGRQPGHTTQTSASPRNRTSSAPTRNRRRITYENIDADEVVIEPGSYEDLGRAQPIDIPQGTTVITQDQRDERCVICQDNLGSGEPVVTTLCQHLFHSSCLTSWSNQQRGQRHITCPTCRARLSFAIPPPQRRSSSLPPAHARRSSRAQQPQPQQCATPLHQATSTAVGEPQSFSQVAQSAAAAQSFSQVARSAAPLPEAARSANPAPICTCPGRRVGRQGRHLAECPVSSTSRRGSTTDPPPETTNNLHGENQAHPPHPEPQPDPAISPLAEAPPFSYLQVAQLASKLPTLQEIPYSARPIVSSAYAHTLRVAHTSVGTRRSNACLNLYAFSVLVLHRPPPSTHRNLSVAVITRNRAREWTQPGGPARLWQQAIESVARRLEAFGPRPIPAGLPEQISTQEADRPHPFGPITHLLSGLSDFPITDSDLHRAEKSATDGMYSRSCASLAAQPLAPETPQIVNQLQELNPLGGLPPEEFTARTYLQEVVAPFTEAEVRKFLSRFPRGAARGPCGLRIDLLSDMVRFPGSNVGVELAAFLWLVVTNQLDPEAMEYLFSARMLAPYKDRTTGAIRPLACGEISRRLSGKMMLARVSSSASAHLLAHKQVAVGVHGGPEAIIHAAQKLVRAYIADPVTHHRKVFVKGDFKNAYNLCSRLKMILAAQGHLAIIEPYLVSAYARRTNLFFGESIIRNESGTQQGDPCATLGFALVLAEACRAISPHVHDALDFEAWFGDDSNIGGDVDAVADFFNVLEGLHEQFGFEYQRSKFEVFGHPEILDYAKTRLQTEKAFPLEKAHAMGAPLGSQQQVDEFARDLLEATRKTFERITAMTSMHKASSVLAITGRGIATYLCRSALPDIRILQEFDALFVEKAATIYGVPLTPEVVDQLSDRYKDGGFGFRPIAPYARVAYIAAELETRVIQALLLKPEFLENTTTRLLDDQTAPALEADVVESIRVHMTGTAGRQLQRKWSSMIDARRIPINDPVKRARILSCAGSHLSTHPIILSGEKFEWLNNARCSMIVRMRLGLPLFTSENICPFCRRHDSDIFGRHVLSCTHGGHRIRIHNETRDDLARIGSWALASTSTEAHCFPNAPSMRIDVLFRALTVGGCPTAADYALVSHATYNLAAAASAIGGAATEYESVKRATYGALAEEAGLYLAPMIQDVFGAWGATARSILAQLARRQADRSGQHRGTVAIMNARWLLSRLQRRVADLLMLATPHEQYQ